MKKRGGKRGGPKCGLDKGRRLEQLKPEKKQELNKGTKSTWMKKAILD